MTPLELLENQACYAIAQAVSCEYSPADSPREGGAIEAAERIAEKIAERQVRILRVVGDNNDGSPGEELTRVLGLLSSDNGIWPANDGLVTDLLNVIRDHVALALAKLNTHPERSGVAHG